MQKDKRAARNARYYVNGMRDTRRESRRMARERRRVDKAAFLEVADAHRSAKREAARIARRQYAGKDAPLSKQVC